MALLEVRDLAVRYGNVEAVRGVSFDVGEGEISTLIGANGAGKTSTLLALSGLLPSSGTVLYEGKNIAGWKTDRIVRSGIVQVAEGRAILSPLTVAENLELGAWVRRDGPGIRSDLEKVYALFPRLSDRKKQLAGTLSGGEQQMLAIGRALMARPRLLLLDEPSMGLAPLMVQKIFETIRAIAATGVTTLLVEQNAKLALEMCDRGYVMESGEITLSDNARALLANPRVRRAYLGE